MKMQMRLLHAAVLLCGAGLLVTTARAQQDGPPPPMPESQGQQQGPPPGGGRMGGPGGGNPEQRLKMLERQLNLTADQTTQVKALFEDERAKGEALRADTSIAPQDKRAKGQAIRKESETKLMALLTPEQQKKYEVIRERMQQRGPGGPGGRGGDGNGPPPPPQ